MDIMSCDRVMLRYPNILLLEKIIQCNTKILTLYNIQLYNLRIYFIKIKKILNNL